MEASHAEVPSAVAEEMESVKRENEELKEVLSAVQLDLEAKTVVGLHWQGALQLVQIHCLSLNAGASLERGGVGDTTTAVP